MQYHDFDIIFYRKDRGSGLHRPRANDMTARSVSGAVPVLLCFLLVTGSPRFLLRTFVENLRRLYIPIPMLCDFHFRSRGKFVVAMWYQILSQAVFRRPEVDLVYAELYFYFICFLISDSNPSVIIFFFLFPHRCQESFTILSIQLL